MDIRIIAVRKNGGWIENPHEAISEYKWINESTNETGSFERLAMVKWVKDGGRAYVKDAAGDIANCFVNHNTRGTEFLQSKKGWNNSRQPIKITFVLSRVLMKET